MVQKYFLKREKEIERVLEQVEQCSKSLNEQQAFMRKRQKVEDKKQVSIVDNGVAYECSERKRMEKPQFSLAQV